MLSFLQHFHYTLPCIPCQKELRATGASGMWLAASGCMTF
jgi:hypothetical protein